MGKHIKVYPTTTDKMVRVLKANAQTLTSASLAMGRAANYISEQIRGYHGVSEPVKVFLELKYNLHPEDYAPDKPTQAETLVQGQNAAHAIPAEVQKELHDLIYAAVLAGTVTALRLTGDEAEQITDIWRKNNA